MTSAKKVPFLPGFAAIIFHKSLFGVQYPSSIPTHIGGAVSAIRMIQLVETRIGQPSIIGQNRHGGNIWSSINRQPAVVPEIYLTWTGLAGDQPTETRPKTAAEGGVGQIHGGNDKAVYAYPKEHYPHWLSELGEEGMGGRSLGENWRLRGVTEAEVHIGDIWQLGEAQLEVSKVRTPCNTLAVYYGGQRMIKRMTANSLCGWYLKVLRPGVVPTRGIIQVIRHSSDNPTVAAAFTAKMRTPAST